MQKRRRRPCDTGPEHTVPSAHGTGTGCAAVLVLAVLFLLYGCAVQRLIYSSRGTMIFLPERPLL